MQMRWNVCGDGVTLVMPGKSDPIALVWPESAGEIYWCAPGLNQEGWARTEQEACAEVERAGGKAGRPRVRAEDVEGTKGRDQTMVAELTAECGRRLAESQAPDILLRAEAALASRGQVMPRPKAAASF